MTVFELLALVVPLGAALGASVLLGELLGLPGYIAGPIVGPLAVYAPFRLLVWLEQLALIGWPYMPPCTNRTCAMTLPKLVFEQGYLVSKCRCGRSFVRERESALAPTHVFELLSGGEMRSYMRWRPFRGWTSQGTFKAPPQPIPSPVEPERLRKAGERVVYPLTDRVDNRTSVRFLAAATLASAGAYIDLVPVAACFLIICAALLLAYMTVAAGDPPFVLAVGWLLVAWLSCLYARRLWRSEPLAIGYASLILALFTPLYLFFSLTRFAHDSSSLAEQEWERQKAVAWGIAGLLLSTSVALAAAALREHYRRSAEKIADSLRKIPG